MILYFNDAVMNFDGKLSKYCEFISIHFIYLQKEYEITFKYESVY